MRRSRYANLALLFLALALAGCGRRGPLEPPPSSPQGQAIAKQRAAQAQKRGIVPSPVDTSTNAEPLVTEDPLTPDDQVSDPDQELQVRQLSQGQGQTPFPTGPVATKAVGRKPPPILRPNKPFLLDPLLD